MSFPPGVEGWWQRLRGAGAAVGAGPAGRPATSPREKQANFGPGKLARPRAGPLGPSQPAGPFVFHRGQGEGRAPAPCLWPSSCLWPERRARRESHKVVCPPPPSRLPEVRGVCVCHSWACVSVKVRKKWGEEKGE